MKIFTKRLWQFAGCALVVTIAMHFAMYYCPISWGRIIIAVLYFCIMFALGWHFGKKDDIENNIYDIGIRWHIVTFIICNVFNYLFWYFLYCRPEEAIADALLKNANTNITIWSAFLLFHFILFLLTRKRAVKGYNKNEIFE